LISTRSSDIILVNEKGANPQVIMRGHFNKTLSGLVCHPNKHEIVTCGGDCLLAKWNINEKERKFGKKLDFSAEALDITNKGGEYLAVGCSNGHV
jgi:WD40 repeat protein